MNIRFYGKIFKKDRLGFSNCLKQHWWCVCAIQCYNQGLNFKRNHGFAEPRTTIIAGDRSIFLHNMIHIFVTNWTDGRIIITFRDESCYTALTLKSSHFWQFGNVPYLKRKILKVQWSRDGSHFSFQSAVSFHSEAFVKPLWHFLLLLPGTQRQ